MSEYLHKLKNPDTKKRIVVDQDFLDKLKQYANEGLYQYEMAERIGITPEYLSELKSQYPQIKALNLRKKSHKGRENKAKKYLWAMIEKMDKNAASLLMFYLKTQHGWVEKKEIKLQHEIPKEMPSLTGLDPIESSREYHNFIKEN